MATIRKLFDETEIALRVEALAREIAHTLPDVFTIVGVLKGSFVFVADLIRALHELGCEPRVEFLRLSSYGHAKESSHEIKLLGEVPEVIECRDVLLVDDILDTGLSLDFAKALLHEHGTAKVWTCTLVDKPCRREIDFTADFVGFTVGDVFVVGYGIDYAERYRQLPYIGAID